MAQIINVIFPVFAVMAAGAFWARLKLPFDQETVTRLTMYIGAPSLAFAALSQMEIAGERLAAVGGAFTLAMVIFGFLGFVALKIWGKPPRWYLPSLTFPNNGNLGLPILLFAFGDEGLALGILIMTICMVGHFSVGIGMAAGRWSVIPALQQPAIWATAAGLIVLVFDLTVPTALLNTAGLVGDLAIPLGLFSLGVALAGLKPTDFGEAAIMGTLRLGLGLVGGFAAVWLFGLEGVAAGVVLIQSMMGAAVFNYMLADLYGGPSDRVAGVVLVSTLIALPATAILLIFVG